MAKKIILLMLILPLLTMIILFTTSNQISLNVDMKVSSVEINDNELVALEMKEENYKINYSVYPTNATNKAVKFIYDESIISVDETGTIIPKNVGQTKLAVKTLDGGFEDSIFIDIYSNTIDFFDVRFKNSSFFVGESILFTPVFNPSNTIDDRVQVISDNPNVIRVNNDKLIGVSKGEANVTFTPLVEPKLEKTYTFKVLNKDVLDIELNRLETYHKSGDLTLSIDTEETYEIDVNVTNVNGDVIDYVKTIYDINTNKVSFNYLKPYYEELNLNITIILESGATLTKTCVIKLIDVTDVDVMFDTAFKKITVGGKTSLTFLTTPSNTPFEYSLSLDNDNAKVIAQSDNTCYIEGLKAGLTTVTLTATLDDVIKTSKMEIMVLPKSLIINEANTRYGIENILTIGKYDNRINLHYSISGELGSNYSDYLSFVSSSKNVVINNDGTFNIKSNVDEVITVKARFGYKNAYIESKPIEIRIVSNGYNVYDYNELRKNVLQEREVVVQKDILEFSEEYVLMDTTYDWDYYRNNNKEKPKVKVLLPIKNNLYGNGYRISADNVTKRIDKTGNLMNNAIFKGPLNFVEAKNTREETNLQTASVKAQDNIVFALFDNVTINNCDLESGRDITDLTELDYTGTVVEVFGDNVNVLNSRIKNGRTILRVFGDDIDPNKVLNVNVENSILSNGREFILRVGSNKFIQDKNNNTPKLPNDKYNNTFPRQRLYFNMNNNDKKYYDENFITNYVTLNNIAFENSGIFSIGMDSHFSGPVLHNANDFGQWNDLITGWYDLAKTSYGTKLILKNDVRIYDWKPLDKVDSSTLIDVIGKGFFEGLLFDVKELLSYLSTNPNFSNITYNDNTHKDYVHGGIAYFGGGKNYNILEYDSSYKGLGSYVNYLVTLSDVGKTILEVAAGSEPFYFYLYDQTSSFSPVEQEKLYNNGAQYDFILK